MKYILSALILSVTLALPAFSEDENISFFNPIDWVRLICSDLERPDKKYFSEDIAVRTDLTAMFNFIDVFDNCERTQFNLVCRRDGVDMRYSINRMTGEMFIFSENKSRSYQCEQVEKVF